MAVCKCNSGVSINRIRWEAKQARRSMLPAAPTISKKHRILYKIKS
jgi:hypothetical protein